MDDARERHALTPLTAEEIAAAVGILRRRRELPARHRFVEVSLHEPPKADVLAGDGRGLDRAAFMVLLDRDAGATYEAVVSLTADDVRSWRRMPDVQPAITLEEFVECERACKADPAWRAAMAKRGIADL